MKIIFQVIKNYPSQEVASVVITTPNKKYYFNIPETFQRFMKNNHIKLNASNSIFLSRLNTSHVCGLFGQMLTMFESKSAIDTLILGPRGTVSFFDRIRFKMGYKILPFSFVDLSSTNQFLYGFRSYETIMDLVSKSDYPSFFYQMNAYIEQNYKQNQQLFQEQINNPNQFITSSNFFKDDICEIHPIIQQSNFTLYHFIPNQTIIQGRIQPIQPQVFTIYQIKYKRG